jgi:hypothetical protein
MGAKQQDHQPTYKIVRSQRKTADVVIERDGSVVVHVPKQLTDRKIDELLRRKGYWIHRNLAEWRDLNATRVLREYRNHEGFLYLGRSYRLLLVSGQEEPLLLKDGRPASAAI